MAPQVLKLDAKFTTSTPAETIELGRKLALDLLPPRGLVLLIGNLGAGKTTLAKGIAEGRGAVPQDDVSSPTFTLIHEYGDPPKVYHIDLYRLEDARQVGALGIEDLLDSDALVLIEWGERFPELWPPDHAEIRIERTGDDHRMFMIRL
ncbi:MAG: tRNA (adenosine(37)-N6)-threonylcarbamoyltransferase complex ATPase subunit type 1 TsaE [Bryobacteraceae bacterium]